MNTEPDDFRLAQRYAYKQLLSAPTTVGGKTYESRAAAQSAILRGIKDPEANRRAVKTVYNALEQDAADAARLAKYNELAEANRPVGGDQKLYDQLTERGRAQFVGGRFEQTLASLGTAPAATPVKPARPTRAADGSPLTYVQDSQWRAPETGGSSASKRATDDLDEMLSQGGTLMVDPLSGEKTVQDLAGQSRAATSEDLANARATAGTLKDAGMGHDTVEFSLFGDPRRRKVLGGAQQAAKAGDSPHKNFRNFLATDEVPDSIFGYPVVQREEDYTPEDIEFFKKNPKAAGFYDTGDEEMAEDVPQQAVNAGQTYDTRLTADQERRYQAWRATLPKRLQYEGDYDLRGYWADPDTVKEGIVDGQHFTDRYKKPNHPTFSVESKYATGENRNRAGRWDGDRFIPPRGRYPGLTNNPGNVEKHELRTDKTLFEGEDGGGVRPKRFARFTDPVLGLKAAATVLARKADELAKVGKPFTIENYAPLYAPPSENDTEAYIKNLSAYSGIPRDMDIDRWDTEHLAKLLKAKVRFETSPEASNWFTDEEYEAAADKLQEGAFD